MSDGKKKSKKGVTMNLTDFLSVGNSVGNWGDDIELPTGPQSDSRSYDRDNVFGGNNRYDNNDRYEKYDKYGNNNNNNDHYNGYERNNDHYGNNNRYGNDRHGGNRNNDRYYGGRQGNQNHDNYGQDQRRHYQNDRYGNNRYDNRDRYDRFENREPRQRPVRPIPENPPYTAYFGNLPEDTTEESLLSIIAPFKVKSIRLITHDDGKLKGFGYVEFEDRADLESVIRGPEILYKNRTLRVDVAEQKEKPEKPEKPSDNSNWRSRSENKNTFSVFGNRNNNNNNQYNNNRQESNWRVRNDNSQGRKPFGNHRTDEPLSSPTPAPAAPPKKKVNPFGDAKPVDTAEIERKVEEKMIKADEEILKRENEEKKEGNEEEKKENVDEEKKESDVPAQAPRERPMSQQKTRSSYYNNRNSKQPVEEKSWRRSTNSAPVFKSTGVFQRNNSNNQRRYNNNQPRNNYNQMRKEEENHNVVETKNAYQVLQDE